MKGKKKKKDFVIGKQMRETVWITYPVKPINKLCI